MLRRLLPSFDSGIWSSLISSDVHSLRKVSHSKDEGFIDQITGVIVEKKDITASAAAQALKKEMEFENEQAALSQNLLQLDVELGNASYHVEQARADFEWIRRLPPIREPSALEEREQVNHLIPHTHVKAKGSYLKVYRQH